MNVLVHLAVLALTVLGLSRFVPGVHIRTVGTAVVVAVVFSVLNFFLAWAIRAVLFVPALLTLGILFFFMPLIVNTIVLWLTDKLLASFEITSTRSLVLSSLVITLVNFAFQAHYFQAICHSGSPRWI